MNHQILDDLQLTTEEEVSIPKRVSEALNLENSKASLSDIKIAFQSLKGFQRLWILVYIKPDALQLLVSIPKRVSEALNRELLSFTRQQGLVSIPKRVSEALNQTVWNGGAFSWLVSIPKRVSEALNPEFLIIPIALIVFQSLKGFQRLWIFTIIDIVVCIARFQSLKGFQRLWIEKRITARYQQFAFQSLKGFQRLWILRQKRLPILLSISFNP